MRGVCPSGAGCRCVGHTVPSVSQGLVSQSGYRDPARRGVAPMARDKRTGSGPPGKPKIAAVPRPSARPPVHPPPAARRKTSAAYSLSLHPVFSRLLLRPFCARAGPAPRLARLRRTCCITCPWFRLFLRTRASRVRAGR